MFLDIEELAGRISRQFGLAEGEIMISGKNNLRSKARKACAYMLDRPYYIPVIQNSPVFQNKLSCRISHGCSR